MTLSDLERGARSAGLPADLHTYAHTVTMQCGQTAIRFGTVTQVGRGVFVRGKAHPVKGRSPSVPQFWGYPYLCPHTLTQNDQIGHGKTHGDGNVLGDQPRPHPKGAGPPAQSWAWINF